MNKSQDKSLEKSQDSCSEDITSQVSERPSLPEETVASKAEIKPEGVKQHLWEKFQALQQRKIHEKSTANKIREKGKPGHKDRKRKNSECVEAGPSKVVPGWEAVEPFLGINDHLKGIEKGRHEPKTKLEEKIDQAIGLGDMETAEKLSDHLSNRQFGKKIADAFDAKRYAEKKEREDTLAKEKAQKKLKWGFDHKERWETKGNM